MVRDQSRKQLVELHHELLECRLCRETFGFQPSPVVQGNSNAKIMQISQAPSKRVHETGKPFNDASGRRLREGWYRIPDEVFYNPDLFYIGSIAHCYPGKAPGGGDRRPPRVCSEQWLSKELELVNNEIYIIVGSYASEFFFPGEKITHLAFEDRQINGKPAYVLPHPSPLNMKWFMDYPEFTELRIPVIRREVHRVLDLKILTFS